MSQPHRHRVLRAVWVVAGLSLASAAWAAPILDCTLAGKQTLDISDTSTIRTSAQEHLPALSGDDVLAAEEARNALLQPLRCKEVSVDFRLKFSQVVVPDLATMVGSPKDHVAMNAVRLAGEMATTSAVDEVLRPALSDKRPAVRLIAAAGLRQTLKIVTAPGAGSIRREGLDSVIDMLGRQLAVETDVNVVEHLVLALDAIPAGGVNAALNTSAMEKLSSAMATQVKALRGRSDDSQRLRWVSALIRATDAVARPMTDVTSAGVTPQFRAVAGVLAGHTLAYSRDRLNASASELTSDSGEGALLRTLVNTSERVLLLADAGINRKPGISRQTLLPAFEQAMSDGDTAVFAGEADKWIGASGTLTKAPYNAKASDFAARTP